VRLIRNRFLNNTRFHQWHDLPAGEVRVFSISRRVIILEDVNSSPELSISRIFLAVDPIEGSVVSLVLVCR